MTALGGAENLVELPPERSAVGVAAFDAVGDGSCAEEIRPQVLEGLSWLLAGRRLQRL